jgi:drug/metabolite transporter (DMT)-like permease
MAHRSRLMLFWVGAAAELLGIVALVMPGGPMVVGGLVLLGGLALQVRAAVLIRRDRRVESAARLDARA